MESRPSLAVKTSRLFPPTFRKNDVQTLPIPTEGFSGTAPTQLNLERLSL
jgi:hypothetical protein